MPKYWTARELSVERSKMMSKLKKNDVKHLGSCVKILVINGFLLYKVTFGTKTIIKGYRWE